MFVCGVLELKLVLMNHKDINHKVSIHINCRVFLQMHFIVTNP